LSGPRLIPPDHAERVTAERVLVLAPHPDDEVLGCGGLLVQLAAAGAAVHVLFLTDGAGGEPAAAAAAYAERRRAEAAAVAELLGFAGVEHLALPDGGLEQHLDAVAAAIATALTALRPDLLLVPSPLEATRDHRAAFAALHRLLAPLRPAAGEAASLAALAAAATILVYEVNRPAYPDLLVDVSAELPRLERAMGLYASQAARRGYWRAAEGLRRYRTLTLGTAAEGPAAAEGYVRLAADDFTTRSPAQLVARLGGVPEIHAVREGPRMSVVVRTRDRPALLAEALASLAAGSYRRAEVVLVNDGGEPPAVPAGFPLPVVRVDLPRSRGRAGAAQAGVEAAGGDYVCFLDDDDLAAPEHLATLAGLVTAAGARVAYTDAAVAVYELAAPGEAAPEAPGGWRCRERRLPYSRDFDPDLLLIDNYIPFNTLAIERGLFAEVGPFAEDLPFFEDWDLLLRLAAVTPFHHLPRVTCEYRHFRGSGDQVFGESPRRRADFLAVEARVLARHAERLSPPALARAVDTLRADRVEAQEAAASHRREAERLAWEGRDLTDRLHRLNGEAESLREERGRLREALEQGGRETQRLYDDEAALRRVVEEQTEQLGRTYGEIQRLEERLRAMEATRAWRLHLRLQRWRGR
jgi:LmbE family N-acetylglucosaminyl deacetylase